MITCFKLTHDLRLANAFTHRGKFHADDVFATIVVILLLGRVILARISSVDEIPRKIRKHPMVYDIGGGVFDHHQCDVPVRPNGIKYASFGLLWRAYGDRILREHYNCSHSDSILLARMIELDLVQGIDASDNGQIIPCGFPSPVMGLGSAISSFYPSWENVSEETEDVAFLQALEMAYRIFDNVVLKCISKLRAKPIVDEAIDSAQGQIMVLDKFVPWKDWLLLSNNPKASKILYVVYPSARNNGYDISAVPKRKGSSFLKKPFPSSWAGLQDRALEKQTSIPQAIACHSARFLASAKTLASALDMAKLAIRSS